MAITNSYYIPIKVNNIYLIKNKLNIITNHAPRIVVRL